MRSSGLFHAVSSCPGSPTLQWVLEIHSFLEKRDNSGSPGLLLPNDVPRVITLRFVHSSAGRRWGCLHSGAVVSRAARDTHVQVLCGLVLLFFLRTYPSGIAGSYLGLFLTHLCTRHSY